MTLIHDTEHAEQASAPATPATGNWKIYFKPGGAFILDDAGNEIGPLSSEEIVLLSAATELTISSGAVTITQSHHTVDTQADASTDDLDTINGGQDGELLYIRAENDARTVVVKHSTGNILIPGGNDVPLDTIDKYLLLLYDSSVDAGAGGWVVINKTWSDVQLSTADVSNPPTDAELDTAFGTPAAVGSGFVALVDDNGAGANVYLVASDGTNWWQTSMTKAV